MPGEVAVDQGLHGGQEEGGAEPAEDRPEENHRDQGLRERHRQGAEGVGEQTDHVGPFAPDEVPDLAVDQDERGGDQRLERDRRLDAARRGAEILDHGRDRHVHHRRVDHQHEHRHRQQEAEPRVVGSFVDGARARGCRHRVSSVPRARAGTQRAATGRCPAVHLETVATGISPMRRVRRIISNRAGWRKILS